MTNKLLGFCFLVFGHWSYAQNLQITGSFEDDNTGRDVPSRVYSIHDGKRQILGKSIQTDVFEHHFSLLMPLNADSILLESTGYTSVSVPVHFYGPFQKKAFASIRIASVNKPVHDKAYLVYCQAENIPSGNKMEVQHFVNGKHHCTQDIPQAISHQSLFISAEVRDESTYEFIIRSARGEVLTRNKFTIKPGLNLIDTNTYPPEETTVEKSTDEIAKLPFTRNEDTLQGTKMPLSADRYSYSPDLHAYSSGIPAIFFDQSKYELKINGRNTLDSLLEYLDLKTGAKITIKGFTDQVGDATLNATLARYRAQVVANYLTTKGLSPERIHIQWNETAAPVPNDTHLNLYRKVIISELK